MGLIFITPTCCPAELLQLSRTILRVVKTALDVKLCDLEDGVRFHLREQVLAELNNDVALVPALFVLLARGRQAMETQTSARSDLEASLWTEVLELTLDIVHTVLRYRPQSTTPSALDKCLLASATDSTDALRASSREQERNTDNAILNIANLAQHKGSPLIPSLATKVRSA